MFTDAISASGLAEIVPSSVPSSPTTIRVLVLEPLDLDITFTTACPFVSKATALYFNEPLPPKARL